MTVSHVLGCGVQKGNREYYRGVQIEANLLPKIQVEIVVSKVPVRSVIETAKKVLYTGHIGDGKIFVYDVENVVKIRTGEEGFGCSAGCRINLNKGTVTARMEQFPKNGGKMYVFDYGILRTGSRFR